MSWWKRATTNVAAAIEHPRLGRLRRIDSLQLGGPTMQQPLAALTPADLDEHPVWEFKFRRSESEPRVAPLTAIPTTKLTGRLFATRFLLANGQVVPGFVASLDEANGALNRHLATFSFFDKGRWFHLARYHDVDYDDRGPDALAAFLGAPPDEVFPMTFDITPELRSHTRI
jgi:hypothetical protein